MTEAYYGTDTAEPAAAPAQEAGDSPGQDETSLAAGYDEDTAALAAEDQLPARQDSRAATWGDSPEYDEYDESDLGAEYDGDLEALTGGDQLPARQESRAATWGDSPVYDDEADLGAEYDGDLEALTGGDQLPARQESRAATWGDSLVYDDEADLGAEYDGDLEALTAEDRSRDAAEDQDPGSPPRENDAREGPGDDGADGSDQGGEDSAAQSHVTHYQANVRGEQLDLWTDGQGHWASDYKRADDALPVDHLADVRSRMGTEVSPATEWADGHAVEVTRDPKDGVWIPGLPGEVPDEAGDVLAGSESPEEKRSRSRDFAGEVVRNTENLFDEVNEVSDVSYKVLHPPEGKAEVPVPAHGPVVESTPHETPVGGMMTGMLAAGIGLWIVGEKLREWRTRGKAGAGHASDA
jgi:hypothetical protein